MLIVNALSGWVKWLKQGGSAQRGREQARHSTWSHAHWGERWQEASGKRHSSEVSWVVSRLFWYCKVSYNPLMGKERPCTGHQSCGMRQLVSVLCKVLPALSLTRQEQGCAVWYPGRE